MSKFNAYLLGFICCLPLGLVLLFTGIAIGSSEAVYSSRALIIVGIITLSLAGILLIAGLVKYGRTTY